MFDPITNLAIKRAKVDGHTMSYVEAGAGPILLLVHGSLCDFRYWRYQIGPLSTRFRVVAPSLPGYWPALSHQADPRFTPSQHAADLASLIDRLGHGSPVHVLGHSRGGRVALDLALLAPRKVASLAVADPGLPLAYGGADPNLQAQAAEALATGDVDAAMAYFIDTVNGGQTWRRMTAWFKQMVRDNANTLYSQVKESADPYDLSRTAAIRCAVLLLGGQYSPARFGRALDALQQTVKHAHRRVVPHASHGMNLGNAPAFNHTIIQFLHDVERPAEPGQTVLSTSQ